MTSNTETNMPKDEGTVRVNREAWLWDVVDKLTPIIEQHEFKVPPVHISVGFPSRRALSTKQRVIGQCYAGLTSKDGKPQIFISPLIDNGVEVVGTVLHELVHATVGTEWGHRAPFTHLARKVGLAGKATATYPGPELETIIKKEILEALPEYPHPKLIASGKFKPQPTRLLKATCSECGYVARVTSKWVEQSGSLICPTDLKPLDVDGYGEVVLNDELLSFLKERGIDLSMVNQ